MNHHHHVTLHKNVIGKQLNLLTFVTMVTYLLTVEVYCLLISKSFGFHGDGLVFFCPLEFHLNNFMEILEAANIIFVFHRLFFSAKLKNV